MTHNLNLKYDNNYTPCRWGFCCCCCCCCFFNYTNCLGLNSLVLTKLKMKDKEQQGGERLARLLSCDQGLDIQWVPRLQEQRSYRDASVKWMGNRMLHQCPAVSSWEGTGSTGPSRRRPGKELGAAELGAAANGCQAWLEESIERKRPSMRGQSGLCGQPGLRGLPGQVFLAHIATVTERVTEITMHKTSEMKL